MISMRVRMTLSTSAFARSIRSSMRSLNDCMMSSTRRRRSHSGRGEHGSRRTPCRVEQFMGHSRYQLVRFLFADELLFSDTSNDLLDVIGCTDALYFNCVFEGIAADFDAQLERRCETDGCFLALRALDDARCTGTVRRVPRGNCTRSTMLGDGRSRAFREDGRLLCLIKPLRTTAAASQPRSRSVRRSAA